MVLHLSAEGFDWLAAVVVFNSVVYVLHTYLDWRQQAALRLPAPPPSVAHLYSADEFAKKRAYNVSKLRYSMVHGFWDFFVNSALLLAGYLPWSWQLAGVALDCWSGGGLAAAGSTGGKREVLQSIIWVLLQGGVTLALSLPWSLYSTFVVEARHGFNKTTPTTFVADTAKSVLLGLLLLPPLVAGFTYILQHSGPYVGLHLWAFLLAVSLLMITIYPTLVAPLFNKFQPLEAGPLREGIESLAASLSFPLKKLFVIDGSTRSAHSNAYMYGFGRNKRIVLYDTLIQQCSEDQVVAVLAHELGHWKLCHMPKLLVAHQLVSLAQLLVFTLVRSTPALFASFGFAEGEQPALAGFLLFQNIIGPLDEVLGLLNNVASRRFEFQADAFGVGLGKGEALREALLVLDKENKGAVNTDKLYSAYHYSHPPLVERLAAIDAGLKKAS